MVRRGRGKKKPIIRNAAKDRIYTLYELSQSRAREGDLDMARHYLEIARKVGMRYTVRIPSDLKMSICKGCFSPLIPGLTSRSRTRNGKTVITCLECGSIKRYEHSGDDADED